MKDGGPGVIAPATGYSMPALCRTWHRSGRKVPRPMRRNPAPPPNAHKCSIEAAAKHPPGKKEPWGAVRMWQGVSGRYDGLVCDEPFPYPAYLHRKAASLTGSASFLAREVASLPWRLHRCPGGVHKELVPLNMCPFPGLEISSCMPGFYVRQADSLGLGLSVRPGMCGSGWSWGPENIPAVGRCSSSTFVGPSHSPIIVPRREHA
jgi:hypothetical protein